MVGKEIPMDLYRKVYTSNVTTPTYAFLFTFFGSTQAFTGDENTVSGQAFGNVRDIIITDDTTLEFKTNDEVFYNGKSHRVEFAQYCDNGLVDHVEIFTANTQWKGPQ